MVFAFAIPTHMHCSMNALITDYLPKAARGWLQCRAGCFRNQRDWLGPVNVPVHALECFNTSVQRSCLRLALVSFKSLAAKYWLTACPCVTLAGPSRYALLGASSVTFLGLLKLNLFGPGITETVRMLWRRPDKAAPAKK